MPPSHLVGHGILRDCDLQEQFVLMPDIVETNSHAQQAWISFQHKPSAVKHICQAPPF